MSKYPSVVTIETGECKVKDCTGLILDKNWVIVQQTECFYKSYQPKHSGERRMHKDEGTEQRRIVAEYIPHPGLELTTLKYYKNDIGLVRVSTPFEFNENVQPIDLAAIEAIAPSVAKSSLKIVGWILAQPMKEDEELLASLMDSPLTFCPIEKCTGKKMEGDDAASDIMCAGKCLVQGEKNQPRRNILYAQENSESKSVPVPVGLGPLKFKGGKPQYGVFLDLAPYIPWIKETAKGQGQSEGQGEEETTESGESESESGWSRIKGGEDAPPYKYKSLVNLETYSSYACTVHNCGGSILNSEWVLTAAHCVGLMPDQTYRVVVSDHDISENDENEQISAVSKIIIYENWDRQTTHNDIALIKVTTPFKFNDRVQKVTLPDPSFEPTGPLTAVGWGKIEDNISPHILQQVQLPFVPLDECQKSYPEIPFDEGQMCAGNSTKGIGKGDSGGALYHISESEEQILVGLTSIVGAAGIGGDRNEPSKMSYDLDSETGGNGTRQVRPGVFTKVSYYIEWIKKNSEMSDK